MCQELQLEKKALKTQLEEAQQKLIEAKQSATTVSATVSLPAKVIIIFSACGDVVVLMLTCLYTGYTAGWETNIL